MPPDARAAAGDDGDLGVREWLFGMQRANQPPGMERENRTAASMHDPARCRSMHRLRRRSGRRQSMYVPAHEHRRAARRAAGADRPARAAGRDDGDRRRPPLGRRRAGRAARVDHGDGHGRHRPGREAPGDRRSRLRLRARPVPGRLGRPADHRALHARVARTSRRWGSASSSARRRSRRCCSNAGAVHERPAPAPPGLGVADASPELLDAVVRMVRLLDAPGRPRRSWRR